MVTDDLDGVDLARLATVRLEQPSYVELVFSIVLVWGFGDAVSTLFAATFAGPHLEANPWLRMLLTHEPLAVIALKMAVVLYVGVVLLECRDVVERVPWWRSWLLVIVGTGAIVTITNVSVGLMAAAAMV